MKLNLAKCAFCVNGRKFLGFMVTQRGTKINSAQVKVVIETLAPNSKKKLHRFIGCLAGKWVDELPRVLWAYWITSRKPKGATLFTLAYGMEVIIPTEIGISTAKTAMKDQMDNDEELIKQLDWAYEKRGAAANLDSFFTINGQSLSTTKGYDHDFSS
uniref:Uncharacterized protein n=1 Tax=Vitis vinifera TaxID=29760 RepID=A5BL37_VITVI|nr:hypothetical protein VITISV_011737 [Vitis vinifera]